MVIGRREISSQAATQLIVGILIALSLNSISDAKKPNVVVVFIDDMGWGDFSCFGNTHAQTPHIDRMAAEGIRFEQFYVNSPICSPSRTAISTGQYPQRWRITSYLAHRAMNTKRGMAQWLDPNAPMLARSLQSNGYATGHFGKWHMGGQRDVVDAPPISDYGFDVSLTNFEGMGPKLLPLTLKPGDRQPSRIWGKAERLGDGYRWMLRSKITSGFVDEAAAFIEEAVAAKKPFYINLWPDDVHSPFWPPVDRWGNGKRELYLSVLEEMDRQLSRLFDLIRAEPSLRDNTLVIICSDNGPEKGAGEAGPFRGYKTHLYEGGIRSSLVVWGPGILTKRNYVNRSSVFSAIDLVPTLLMLTESSAPENTNYDGEVLLDVLLGKSEASRNSALYFRRPPDRDAFYGDFDLPDLAVRSGRWKLLCEYDGTEQELYDLDVDRAETNNLLDEHAKIASNLTDQVVAWHQLMPPDKGADFAKSKKAK
ncbi:MAG: sulfatase-like hydrolase/transferase [Pirellulaceae bacterium]|nr:sulfatase-like hydrolase/transferase [Pirellulaceae bacterium]